jgi:hypothetical protein
MSDRFCAVCGDRDARALSSTRLAGGELVTVCGTHELMHRRATATARSLTELRALVMNRRTTEDRRGAGSEEYDELGQKLALAFSSDRRAHVERRT